MSNIKLYKYYFGNNKEYDKHIFESFKVRFKNAPFPWFSNNIEIITLVHINNNHFTILACCQIGQSDIGDKHTIWNLFKTLKAENIKHVCSMFLKKLFQYYNSNYIQGEKMLNLYVIPEISPAAYKSYLYNGFKIKKEKNFKVTKNNNNYEAIFMKKN
tara:strand:+ start:9328 stop:9801 length:474 start_codon:yes stop_codon:yes gene_type:complete